MQCRRLPGSAALRRKSKVHDNLRSRSTGSSIPLVVAPLGGRLRVFGVRLEPVRHAGRVFERHLVGNADQTGHNRVSQSPPLAMARPAAMEFTSVS